MASDMNTVCMIGRLVRDPELKTTASGSYVARFRIANNRMIKNSGSNEWESRPSFFNIVVWGQAAMNCNQYLHKGSKVAIQGRLEQRSWQDNQGQQQSIVEIIAFSVQFLDPKGSAAGGDRQNSDYAGRQYEPNYEGSQEQSYNAGPAGAGAQDNQDANSVEFEGPIDENFTDDDLPF